MRTLRLGQVVRHKLYGHEYAGGRIRNLRHFDADVRTISKDFGNVLATVEYGPGEFHTFRADNLIVIGNRDGSY
jgi:hypothetical protein